jgi:hypothetical protein
MAAAKVLARRVRRGYKERRAARKRESVSIADRLRFPDERFSPITFYALCPADTVKGNLHRPPRRDTTNRTLLFEEFDG